MDERQNLRAVQEQRLQQKLSPQQLEYARMLEMTGPEMEEEVRRQLDDNPALEAEPDTVKAPGTEPPDMTSRHEYVDFYTDRAGAPMGQDAAYLDSSESESLIDYLDRQLNELNLTERERQIASLIIGNIDANGYMTRRTADIADDASSLLGADIEPPDVARVWRQVRTLDPSGIGAVDLRDCLLLQLDRRKPDKDTQTAREIVADYFDLFAGKSYDRLMSETGIDGPTLRKAVETIRSLHPKPGAQFGGNSLESLLTQVTPDFIAENDGNQITLTMPDSLPSLRVEESFDISDTPSRRQSPREKEAGAFIRSKRDEALSFIQAVRMRRKTLYDVMRAIISLQRDFFAAGGDTSLLKPMILKDVAEVTGYDVSVISRATAGKYVATRTGLHSLKSLFGERPGGADSDASAAQVLNALREIIAGENPEAPMSDDALVKALNSRGFDIARRTVAKYRDRAGIPVARLRRRLPS